MEKTKKVQNKQQPLLQLKEYNLHIDLKRVLKNILNKDDLYIIPVFIPHFGCKNDCVFCNQRKITGVSTNVTSSVVDKVILEHLDYIKEKKNKKVEIAFFGGSFTGIPIEKQIEFLEVANKYIKKGLADSIRISTRPDYISPSILKMLKKYNVEVIELGVQSMDDEVLSASKRGHLKKDVLRAAKLIKLFNITLGIQIMVGLPKSTEKKEISCIKEVLKLNSKYLRIYPVYVLKDSKLYDMYKSGEYIPLTVEKASNRVAQMLNFCRDTDVKVIRIGLQSTNEIKKNSKEIIGPVSDNFAEYAMSRIVLDEIEKFINNDKNLSSTNLKKLNIYVKKEYMSVIVGPKKINKEYLKNKYSTIIKVKGE